MSLAQSEAAERRWRHPTRAMLDGQRRRNLRQWTKARRKKQAEYCSRNLKSLWKDPKYREEQLSALLGSKELRDRMGYSYKKLLRRSVLKDYLERQGYRCAICNDRILRKAGHLALDHDHRTGAIRGVLCSRCNRALGGFCDSQELLKRAIRYLKVRRIPRFPRSRSRLRCDKIVLTV